jgi:hypothetical protein
MSAKDHDIPLAYVREALTVDLTGVLMWLIRPREHFDSDIRCRQWNTRYAGRPAGTAHSRGYLSVCLTVDGQKRYILAHRLIWALMTGAWPEFEIDHADGDPANTRWSNLRPATHAENLQNLTLEATNTSGLRGVSWDEQTGRWRAQIQHNRQRHSIGRFATKEQAHMAYLAAKARLHPFQPKPRSTVVKNTPPAIQD